MVGETGEVVGVDRAQAALETARARATARSLRNVIFQQGDPAEMTFERRFDAIVGRYVLQFQQDPSAMLRRLVRQGVPSLVDRGQYIFQDEVFLEWAFKAIAADMQKF
jgi:ubiquinone/menaquinone biosynthesis C-methylase UbiE